MTEMVAVGDVLCNMGLAPKAKACWICQNVAQPEHVTALLIDDQGNRKPTTEAVDYLLSLGLSGKRLSMQKRALAHVKHILAYARSPYPIVRAKLGERLTVPHTDWLSATQRAVDLGSASLDQLAARLMSGEMEDADVIALAKLGVTAAGKQGSLAARGASLKQVDRIMALAAGLPLDVIEGEAREVE